MYIRFLLLFICLLPMTSHALLIAQMKLNPNIGSAPLTVTLDASDTQGEVLIYEWRSSDGQVTSGKTSTFTFLSEGTYQITLTVTNELGKSDSAEGTVRVPPPCKISAKATATPNTVNVGESVTLDGSGSSVSGCEVVEYVWESSSDGQRAAGETATMKFNESSTYPITLTVSDLDTGKKHSSTVTIVVPPQCEEKNKINAVIRHSVSSECTINVDASDSTPQREGMTYTWYASDQQKGSGASTQLTFDKSGKYIVRLEVTDTNTGCFGSNSVTTSIDCGDCDGCNEPPIAVANVSPLQGQAPLSITLNASQSNDLDGSIVKYEWQLDEQIIEGKNSQYTFTQAGTYKVRLTVIDNNGKTDSEETTVIVEPPATTGKALIIAAGGNQASNSLFAYTNRYTNSFYRTLTQLGYSSEDIYYMNPLGEQDLNEDSNSNEVTHNLIDPLAELEAIFSNLETSLKPEQQFVVYIHGHARPDHIQLNETTEIDSTTLKNFLSRLPSENQIVVIDTCYSGSFLSLSAPHRTVITSTDVDNLSWNVAYASFSEAFIQNIRRGDVSLKEVFDIVEGKMASNPVLYNKQRPQLDASGDGQYTEDDKSLAAGLYIGVGTGPLPPKIDEIHPYLEAQPETTLWVTTLPNDESAIKQVKATLVSPNQQQTYQGIETAYRYPELDLIYNTAQQRYEATVTYDDFSDSGIWRIFYQAQDRDGLWSEEEMGKIEFCDCTNGKLISPINDNIHKAEKCIFPPLADFSAVDKLGNSPTAEPTFFAGFTLSDSCNYIQTGNMTFGNAVSVVGQINVEPNHVGREAEILVFAGNRAPKTTHNEATIWYSLLDTRREDGNANFDFWLQKNKDDTFTAEDLATLPTFLAVDALEAKMAVPLWSGGVVDGTLKIYFGYRLVDGDEAGSLFTNAKPIFITINNPDNPFSEDF